MNAMQEKYCNRLAELSDYYCNLKAEDNERMARVYYDEMAQQVDGMMKSLSIVEKAFSQLQTEAGRRSQDDEN